MGGCSFPNCHNSSEKGFKMLRFSRSIDTRRKWATACNISKPITDNFRLCEGHFSKGLFDCDNHSYKLRKNIVPDILNPSPPKPFDAVDTDDADDVNDNNYSFSSKRRKSGVSDLAEGLGISVDENIEVIREDLLDEASNNFTDTHSPHNLHKSPRELQLEQQIDKLLNENASLKSQVIHMTERSTTFDKNLKKFLNPDQLSFLKGNAATNSKPWSEETIKKGLRIRLLMGTKVYKNLRDTEGFPLPAFSTLYNRLFGFNFAPGIFNNIIEWLGVKIQQEHNQTAHYCILALDEISIHPAVEYDRALGKFIGLVTPELARNSAEADSMASHAIAFVARGLQSHWKQLIGYALTGKSVTSTLLWNYVQEIIKLLYQHGIVVKCIATDEGSTNVGMWTLNSISSSRFFISSFSQHPSNSEERLHWTSDVPHILKRIWSQLLKTKFILSAATVEANNLPSSEVDITHVRRLMELQSVGGPVLVKGLTAAILDPSQFDKMHVGLARKIFSNEMGHALVLSAQTGLLPHEAVTTGWFITLCSQWYESMVCRHKSNSLGTDEASLERVEFLQSFIEIIRQLQFSSDNKWKPIQRGIILATTTALNSREDLVISGKLQYLLTGRLTSSSVENLFSQVRAGGDIHPKPRQLRYRMRLIAVAQYLRVPSSASYEDDDEPYYVEFLKQKKTEFQTDDDETQSCIEIPQNCELSEIQNYGLYYLCGWAVFVSANSCSDCETAIISPVPLSNASSAWTDAINRGNLKHPTEAVYQLLKTAEKVFTTYRKSLLHLQSVHQVLMKSVQEAVNDSIIFPKCHEIRDKVLGKFISLRLHILAKDITVQPDNPNLVIFSSRSAYMRTSTKNVRA